MGTRTKTAGGERAGLGLRVLTSTGSSEFPTSQANQSVGGVPGRMRAGSVLVTCSCPRPGSLPFLPAFLLRTD